MSVLIVENKKVFVFNECLSPPHEGEGWEGGAFDFKINTIPF
jgi:hypothetical protein